MRWFRWQRRRDLTHQELLALLRQWPIVNPPRVRWRYPDSRCRLRRVRDQRRQAS